MSFLEKRQLANELFVSKVNCDGNTLLSVKKELKISPYFLKSTMQFLKSIKKYLQVTLNFIN